MRGVIKAFVLALVVSAVAAAAAGTASAQTFTCNGLYQDITIRGDVFVPSGATCRLVRVNVQGNIFVQDRGAIRMQRVAVTRNVQIVNARWFRIHNSAIAGSVQITGTTGYAPNETWNTICATTIARDLQVTSNRARIAIGDFVACTEGNRIGGNVQITGNTAQVRVSNNQIQRNLQCSGNRPPATGENNRVDGVAQGEGCAASRTGGTQPQTQPLTVSTAGDGTVTGNGISCGPNSTGDCSHSYSNGTVVTLTATPGEDAQFTGWGGACSGTSPTCNVTMNQARTVSATFEPIPTT